MKKKKSPGFSKCLSMMKSRRRQTMEDGFHWLLPHAGEHVCELIEAFGKEKEHGLRCWLLELIGAAQCPDAFQLFAELIRSNDWQFRSCAIRGLKNLGTKESRTLLWQARSFLLASKEETDAFRVALHMISNDRNH
jgi:hypothetical protein